MLMDSHTKFIRFADAIARLDLDEESYLQIVQSAMYTLANAPSEEIQGYLELALPKLKEIYREHESHRLQIRSK
jgi:hypothetical protein